MANDHAATILKHDAEIARLREENENGKRYKSELDMIARAVYPHKEGGFTYSALFICDEISDTRAKLDRMRKALEALVNKLDLVHKDHSYMAVWQMAAVHGCVYDGPTYADELTDARLALNSQPTPQT